MNANLFSKMKNIFVILFILSLSFPIKAQDTIKFNTGTKYYWNNELTNSDSTKRQLAVSTLGYGPYDTEKKCARWKAIAFPPNTEKMVYGIAGTTILCENPKGCFFYLMKKVNINDTIRYEIIESAEWNNNSFAGYIDYNIDTSFTPTLDYPASLYRNQIFHDGDSSVQKVYEVYFSTPRALTDTFYIGMSTNLYIPYPNQFYSNDHTVIVGYLPIPWDERYYSRWLLYDPEIDVCQDIRSPYHGGLFAIVEPDSNVCPNVNNVWVENVDTNSAVIEWIRPYIATYYNVEYGVEGFARGTGTIVDSINENNTTITLSNLLPNTNYEFYIQAYCNVNDTLSNWRKITFQTLNPLDLRCPAVENLDTVYVRDTRAKISWNIITDNIEYCEIEWGESGFEQGNGTFDRNIYDSSYFFHALTPGTAYDVYVRSYCPHLDEYSPWEYLTFTTQNIGITTADKENSPIDITPNPTTGIVEVSLPQGFENREVQLYDLQGILLQTKVLQTGIATFDLSAYPNGVYIIKVGEASCRVVKNK